MNGRELVDEFHRLLPSQQSILERACPDLYRSLAQFVQPREADAAGAEAFTTAQAAAMLGITPRAVSLAVKREKLTPAKRDEYGYVFDRGELEKYRDTRQRRAVA